MSLQALKKNRKSNLKVLTEKLEETQEKRSFEDDRFWKPIRDKSGNGYAVIRFLPQVEGESVPWARLFSHGFQGTGGWYIENSLTTLNQPDPVSEYNTSLWNNGTEAGKDQARKQKRRLNYISNIYVVKDTANPDNEGKVFLYKYGKKIFDKINEAMNPEFEDETAINPFDFWEGADFLLKIRTVDGFVNYDKSEFTTPDAFLDGDDDKLEELYATQKPLKEFTDQSNFKTYDELKAKMERCLGLVEDTATSFDPDEFTEPKEPISVTTEETEGGEDTLQYFQSLAAEQ